MCAQSSPYRRCWSFVNSMGTCTALSFWANRTQALNYGCIVANAETQEVQHYVEKPSTFVSEIINCGIYLFTPAIFQHIGEVFQRNQQELALEESSNGWQRAEVIRLEQDVFTALAGSGKLYVYKTDGFWSQIKSAGSAIYASRLYLNQYSKSHPERLAQNKPGGPVIRGNVYIHPTASIDSTAVLGPNVSIGEGVTVGAGVRVRESIVLHGASLHDHTCVLNTIVGWDSTIGRWARVEGTPSDPNPNDPYAKIDSETLFRDGRLTPSITILGAEPKLQKPDYPVSHGQHLQSPCCAPQQEPALRPHIRGGSQHTQRGRCMPGALQVPEYCSRQDIKADEHQPCMLLLLQPRDEPQARVKALGTVRGSGTSPWAYAGSTCCLQCLGCNLVCFSTKGHYQHHLATPHQALPAHFLSATPWKGLAHLQDLGVLNVPVMCRQLTLQE
ncbi:mannose-1-phosphate guanyltransferase alpha isoform X2 [Cinclus cinclus]|uniref:mannose-1-phosphate guanyltransferase alpha isoform X2 n=1 Tax=Cinclus cinclus TaxID=127875 RepID=UPI002E10510F